MDAARGMIQINYYLPKEVLGMIMDRLPFRARQNAKLVCRQWFNILLGHKFRVREKTVLRGLYSVEEILDVLSEHNGGLRNLEFQNVYLDAEIFDSSFWIEHGKEIRELHFYDCTRDPETTFLCMVDHCPKLESLHWRSEEKNNSLICSSETLDFLIHADFSRQNLLAFETDSVSLNWLYKFRKVFPNAEHVSYFLDPSSCIKDNAKETRKISLINDGDKLKLPNISGKKLSLRFRNLSEDFLLRTLISANELRRLQEIEISTCSMERFPVYDFIHIVSEQPLLEKFRFVAQSFARSETYNFGMHLLEVLFGTSHELRWLYLDLGNKFDLMINATLLLKMINSKLSYLVLRNSGLRFDRALYDKKYYENVVIRKNRTLRHLRVGSRLEFKHDMYVLLQSFTRLDHLQINWSSSNELLKTLVTHQSQLKSLEFFAQMQTPSVEQEAGIFANKFYDLQKLRSLKYKGLPEQSDEERNLEKDILLQFYFPHLEYLHVDIEHDDAELFEIWLNILSTGSKELRALRFCNPKARIPFESWLTFCSSMKKLEYLYLKFGHDEPNVLFTEEKFHELLHASPSLRVIVQTPPDSDNWEYTSAVYDRVRKEILINKTEPFFIGNSNLDHYNIDWLYF